MKTINNFVAKHAQSSGSGFHQKSNKAIRKRDRELLEEELHDSGDEEQVDSGYLPETQGTDF